MITVKVLGTGCPTCKKLEQVTKRAIGNLGIPAELVKVTDMVDIMRYEILTTPGLVINEVVVCSGRLPTEPEVMTWLVDALEAAGKE